MAISVDTVYQTVLALANKEQGGYITPQEFNLFANHAQSEIFEQYFYDLNQFKRLPGTQQEDTDRITILEEKLSTFYKYNIAITPDGGGQLDYKTDLTDLYRLNELRINYDTTSGLPDGYNYAIAEELSLNDHSYQEKGTLLCSLKFEQKLESFFST